MLDPSPDDDKKFTTSSSMPDQSLSAGRDSRKMILNSYEQAGVDLPLTQLETILDREVLADSFSARQSCGGPRFRKLLGRASSVINQRKDKDSLMVQDDELICGGGLICDNDDDGDDNFDDEVVCNTAQNNDNDSAVTPDKKYEDQSQPMMPVSTYIDVPTTTTTKMNDINAQGQGRIQVSTGTGTGTAASNGATTTTTTTTITPATSLPYSPVTGTTPFDFCCPESTSSQKKDDKYVVSNLQLAEGFDDEYHNHHAIGNGRSIALMDLEESMDTTFTVEKSTTHHERNKHHPGKGKHGMIRHFRGSRRFRIALFICCLLHLILVSLIITFVMTMDNDTVTNGYEADASIIPPDQATPSSSPNSTDMIASVDLIASNTLFPDDQQMDDPPAVTTSATAEKVNSTQNSTTVIDQEVSTEVVNDPSSYIDSSATAATTTTATVSESESESCVDKLELSLNCFDRDSEVLVFFQSCTPQPGDWVAIYDISHDPENLLDSDSIAWLYTCGNRRCNEPIQNEVLPFSRVADRVPAGRYRAYLIRNGRGPVYSSFASSPDFRVAECQEL